MGSPPADFGHLAELTQLRVRDEAVREPLALARRVEDAAAAFLAVARDLDGSEAREWPGQVGP
jgi:hypothetical protein